MSYSVFAYLMDSSSIVKFALDNIFYGCIFRIYAVKMLLLPKITFCMLMFIFFV